MEVDVEVVVMEGGMRAPAAADHDGASACAEMSIFNIAFRG